MAANDDVMRDIVGIELGGPDAVHEGALEYVRELALVKSQA
jgi:hypothetical protein